MKRENHLLSNKRKIKIGCVLLAAGFVLLLISKESKEMAQWYSTTIYPIWVNVLGRVTGILPFSVAEVLLYILVLTMMGTILWLGVQIIQKKRQVRDFGKWFSGVFLMVGILFFLYVIHCGINYNRNSFAESSGIQIEEYSVEELQAVCAWLTKEINTLSDQVERSKEGTVVVNEEQELAVEAMKSLGKEYSELEGYYPKPKKVLVHQILSVQQISGIYSPFTIEANYNGEMPAYSIPFTACHELSHLRGFMQEEEANFIAFLACTKSSKEEFAYSGYLSGWVYCMNVLYREDNDVWKEMRAELSALVEADLKASHEFWSKYDGRIAEVATQVNDTYLKSQGQEEGVKSYNQMVDLMVAYYSQLER